MALSWVKFNQYPNHLSISNLKYLKVLGDVHEGVATDLQGVQLLEYKVRTAYNKVAIDAKTNLPIMTMRKEGIVIDFGEATALKGLVSGVLDELKTAKDINDIATDVHKRIYKASVAIKSMGNNSVFFPIRNKGLHIRFYQKGLVNDRVFTGIQLFKLQGNTITSSGVYLNESETIEFLGALDDVFAAQEIIDEEEEVELDKWVEAVNKGKRKSKWDEYIKKQKQPKLVRQNAMIAQ